MPIGWCQEVSSSEHWFFILFFVYFSRQKSSNQLSFEDFFFSLYDSTAGTWRNWQTRPANALWNKFLGARGEIGRRASLRS